jgi:hypothetical protein
VEKRNLIKTVAKPNKNKFFSKKTIKASKKAIILTSVVVVGLLCSG